MEKKYFHSFLLNFFLKQSFLKVVLETLSNFIRIPNETFAQEQRFFHEKLHFWSILLLILHVALDVLSITPIRQI